MQEIILPDDVEPALEWVNNRILQKVSPSGSHALAQRRFASALGDWADERGAGAVGTEWRFQVQPAGEIRRSLVPDIAFLSYDSVPSPEIDLSIPPVLAPDVVVEIRSPDDRAADIDEKVRVYLAAGTKAIFLVDPGTRSVRIIDRRETREIRSGSIAHESLTGFQLQSDELFDLPKPRRR